MNPLTKRGSTPRRIGDYLMPDYLRSREDYGRVLQRDLPEMTNLELFAEDQMVRPALGLAVGKRWLVALPGVCCWQPAEDWLRDRVQAIATETAWRRSLA
jgi:hypothetical protein